MTGDNASGAGATDKRVGCLLGAAVESVRQQTYADFEFMIVDDGSTDGSFKIAQEIATRDSRIRVIRSVHEGPAAVRNRGLALAKGTVWSQTSLSFI
jgi:glycosyltransferase involved in cell wall biosynthesis